MLPNLALLEQVRWKIQTTPNRQGEYKRKTHYCCYLLCEKAGLRVSEAINFDLSSKTRKGLYYIKSKGKKKRLFIFPSKSLANSKNTNESPIALIALTFIIF